MWFAIHAALRERCRSASRTCRSDAPPPASAGLAALAPAGDPGDFPLQTGNAMDAGGILRARNCSPRPRRSTMALGGSGGFRAEIPCHADAPAQPETEMRKN